jgi:hypothetical protein
MSITSVKPLDGLGTAQAGDKKHTLIQQGRMKAKKIAQIFAKIIPPLRKYIKDSEKPGEFAKKAQAKDAKPDSTKAPKEKVEYDIDWTALAFANMI